MLPQLTHSKILIKHFLYAGAAPGAGHVASKKKNKAGLVELRGHGAQTTDSIMPGADRGQEERPGKSSSRRRWGVRVSLCAEPAAGRARAAPAPLLYGSVPPAQPAAPAACWSRLGTSEGPAPLGPAACAAQPLQRCWSMDAATL